MSLITASDLGKSFGPVDIFGGISLSIPRDARIAIVGPNGIGKTTLLRILLGIEEPTSGNVTRARNLKLGYLPQEAALDSRHTLWDECLNALADLRAMESELRELEHQMSSPDLAEDALIRYGKLQVTFENLGGYTYETRIRQILTGLGFETTDFQRPITQLSGGQRTRAVLARLLLSGPDILILDEPTNHLDIRAVEWLEGYLSQWAGAVLIVSHDRYFLDRVVDHIWEMRRDGLETYRGNYTAYIQQRQERWELLQKIYISEKERLEKELDYIKRNIAGQNTTQAKGKLRRLSREIEAIQNLGFAAVQNKTWAEISSLTDISEHSMGVEEVERRIHSLRPPVKRPPHLHLNLKANLRSGDLVLRTRNLAIGYPDEDRPLFTAPDLLLKRGECAAIIGPNGAGKTTFLKTLLNKMPPLAGEVILGASLKIGYFAQAHEGLQSDNTLVKEIDIVAPQMLLGEIRDYLARFMFSGEDVFKRVSMLSGGERGRLALAKLSLAQANLLLLDEPTNHLDIPAQEVLQEVLDEFQGTILLVSHDRYLIDALGSQIWEIEPDQAELKVFAGTYSEYKALQGAEKENVPAHQAVAVRQNRTSQQGTGNEERRLRNRIKELEETIHQLEVDMKALAQQLENPPSEPAKVQELGEKYVHIQAALESQLEEWGKLGENLQNAEA
ncbi:MAG TPA: ABC-F family ATP-binding cassette domain-containing protein [Anaerolineales bacterium]|nr:ABC-F family ATP-binding cassette domain-containing protein [Anaerolineales bacterium]